MKPARRSSTGSAAGRSSSRAVIALVLMGALVLVYGWNKLFLAPRSGERAEVTKELAAAQKQERDLRQNMAELRKLAAETQSREAELARLGRLVPGDADVAGAILALDATAKQAQVEWASFVPSPPGPAAAGAPASMSIGMKVGGTFNQIFDYLRRLETLDRLVVVDGVTLSANVADGAGSPRIEADVKARMFAATGRATPTAASGKAKPAPSGAATDDPVTTAALPEAGD